MLGFTEVHHLQLRDAFLIEELRGSWTFENGGFVIIDGVGVILFRAQDVASLFELLDRIFWRRRLNPAQLHGRGHRDRRSVGSRILGLGEAKSGSRECERESEPYTRHTALPGHFRRGFYLGAGGDGELCGEFWSLLSPLIAPKIFPKKPFFFLSSSVLWVAGDDCTAGGDESGWDAC